MLEMGLLPGGVAHIWLARTEARNALSAALIAELVEAIQALGMQQGVRVIVLGGRGPDFCAGADIREMRTSGEASREENLAAAEKMAALFAAIYDCPRPVIARAHGGVYGGGVGLVAACDVPIAAESAIFSLSEVRLGILPAVISPYVVRRIGERNARELFLTGARFGADRAREVGLVQYVAPDAELDAAVMDTARKLLDGGPEAQARIKRLLPFIASAPMEEARRRTPQEIADARAGAEAREGLTAFLEKRKPKWAPGE
jgi:methylglutaconyl-CoA hydratase